MLGINPFDLDITTSHVRAKMMIFESNIVGTFLMSLENREKWGHDINVEGE